MENISAERFEELKRELEETRAKISEINKVDGFNPSLLVTCYSSETEDRLYLQAEPAMVWFRLKHPKGRLEQIATRVNDAMATIEGRVYDDDGNLLANAFVTRYRNDNDTYGKDYVQNAGTSAIRKALGNCGFGTPYGSQYIEGITERVDLSKSGVTAELPVDNGRITPKFTVPGINASKKAMNSASANAEKEAAAPVPQQTQTAAPEQNTQASQVTSNTTVTPPPTAKRRGRPKKVEDAPEKEKEKKSASLSDFVGAVVQTCQNESEHVPDETNSPTESTSSSNNEPASKTQESNDNGDDDFTAALAFTVPNGRYAGKTFKELLDSGEKSVIAYFLKPLYAGQPAQAAALVIAKHCPLD